MQLGIKREIFMFLEGVHSLGQRAIKSKGPAARRDYAWNYNDGTRYFPFPLQDIVLCIALCWIEMGAARKADYGDYFETGRSSRSWFGKHQMSNRKR
jgi:hypothetical protein